MVNKIDKKAEFGSRLRVLLAKYNIKQKDVANLIGKTPQYISKILSGKASFVADQFNSIYDFLIKNNANKKELTDFAQLFIESRMNFDRLELQNYTSSELPPIDTLIMREVISMTDNQKITLYNLLQSLNQNNASKTQSNFDALFQEFKG
ncbi:MAG: helix-turn-helix transcriptional regulator [Lentisphaerae bacterium]|nr:helix-turn-helix transcriptional regulator [Lentisphaerota bacterium]MCP4102530.1 helix-turn-helix transcriptional regulator [Lentisphaerota bacterium]